MYRKVTLLCICVFILSCVAALAQRGEQSFDVCQAAQSKISKTIVVRGAGEVFRGQLGIADLTCPAATAPDSKIPTIILIEVGSFASRSMAETYQKYLKSEDRVIYQILARGDMECVKSLSFERNESGEILSGNGFGSNGFARCRLKEARIEALEVVVSVPRRLPM